MPSYWYGLAIFTANGRNKICIYYGSREKLRLPTLALYQFESGKDGGCRRYSTRSLVSNQPIDQFE